MQTKRFTTGLGKKSIMHNKIYDLAKYNFKPKERILLDANIWILLQSFLSTASDEKLDGRFVKYSAVFYKLVKSKAIIFIDLLVLNEYLHHYTRVEWRNHRENYPKKYPKYKNFRDSDEFQNAISTASQFARKIIELGKLHSIPADKINISQALDSFSSGGIDFNDAILTDICKQSNFKIITDDVDFKYGGIDVLTLNSKLLAKN